MSNIEFIPVVMNHDGQEDVTDNQLENALELVQNVAAGYERMLGRECPVGDPIAIKNTRRPPPLSSRDETQRVAWDKETTEDTRLYEGARDTLTDNSLNPNNNIFLVYLLGNPQDGSGRGGPWVPSYPIWQVLPDVGGVAVMGELSLKRFIDIPIGRDGYYQINDSPRGGFVPVGVDPDYHSKYNGEGIDIRYPIWLGIHESGHALGLEHTGGEPNDPIAKRQSVMAYGRHRWVQGLDAHRVGLRDHEWRWLLEHRMFRDNRELSFKSLDQVEMKRFLSGKIRADIALGPGMVIKEFFART